MNGHGDPAVAALEEQIEATHGGVEQQAALHRPSHLPLGVPHTVYDEVSGEQSVGLLCIADSFHQ